MQRSIQPDTREGQRSGPRGKRLRDEAGQSQLAHQGCVTDRAKQCEREGSREM